MMTDPGTGARTQAVTINTPHLGDRAVTVRAPEPRIQRYFLNPLPECLSQIGIKIAVSFHEQDLASVNVILKRLLRMLMSLGEH